MEPCRVNGVGWCFTALLERLRLTAALDKRPLKLEGMKAQHINTHGDRAPLSVTQAEPMRLS